MHGEPGQRHRAGLISRRLLDLGPRVAEPGQQHARERGHAPLGDRKVRNLLSRSGHVEDPPSRLRLDVAFATLETDRDGQATGWVRVRGERVLPEGVTRWEETLVRLPALPDQLTITHQGARVEIRELQQTHSVRDTSAERFCNG